MHEKKSHRKKHFTSYRSEANRSKKFLDFTGKQEPVEIFNRKIDLDVGQRVDKDSEKGQMFQLQRV